MGWVPAFRALVVAAGSAWSVRLAWRMTASLPAAAQRVASTVAFSAGVVAIAASWALLYGAWA